MAGQEIAGRYRLEELLGGSAMSEVWRAYDRELARTVAVKLLAPTAEGERFHREARAVASLSHENVTQLFDYGEEDGRPFMVLEYLPGGTLADRLAAGPLPLDETQRIAHGIAAGLAHAHARGVVHRDLKPANVLFDAEDRPKLVDFGIARLAGGGTLTEAGTVLGTAATISPEQAAGEPAGPASDVYSFGVVLFRMLTGRLPFEAADPLALAELHRHAAPPPAETLREGVPPALAALAAAALAKDPAARPPDGAAVLAELDAAGPPEAEATLLLPGAATASSRGRRASGVAVAALLLVAAAGGGLAWAVTRHDAATTTTGGATIARLTRHTTTRQRATTAPTTQAPVAPPPTTAQRPPRSTTRPTTTSPTTRARTTTAPPPASTIFVPPPTTVPPATTVPPTAATTATTTTATATTAATTAP